MQPPMWGCFSSSEALVRTEQEAGWYQFRGILQKQALLLWSARELKPRKKFTFQHNTDHPGATQSGLWPQYNRKPVERLQRKLFLYLTFYT